MLAELQCEVEQGERARWWRARPHIRPYDVLYKDRLLSSTWVGIDVGIADPTRVRELRQRTGQAFYKSGQAANRFTAHKKHKYNVLLHKEGSPRHATKYMPFVIEASGGFGPGAKQLYMEWVSRATDQGIGSNYRKESELAYDKALDDFDPAAVHEFTWSALDFSSFWLQRISFVVSKCIAVSVLDGVRRAAVAAVRNDGLQNACPSGSNAI